MQRATVSLVGTGLQNLEFTFHMNIDVSVIIPVHNAAGTIERAVDSIPKNPGFSYEILIVENQSRDDTPEVIEGLARRDPHIRILTAEQAGVSCARNLGLDAAQGNWIMFLDADDSLLPGSGPILAKAIASQRADLVLFSFESGNSRKYVLSVQGVQEYTQIEHLRVQMLSDPTRYMQVWSKLFRKSLIAAHHLRFDDNLTVAEDSDFTFRFTRYCKSISLSHDLVYHYSVDSPSVMRTYDGTKAAAYLDAMRAGEKIAAEETPAIQHAFTRYVLMHLNIVMVRDVFCRENPDSFSEKIDEMRALLREDSFQKAIGDCQISECRNLRMSAILCLKLHWYRAAALIFQIRASQNSRREGAS